MSEELKSEHIPSHLLCQVHPSLMFNHELVKVWKEVDNAIDPQKIFAGFSVSISDEQVSVTEQWIDCLLRLVSHDFDHKAWSYAEEFDIIHSSSYQSRKKTSEREI